MMWYFRNKLGFDSNQCERIKSNNIEQFDSQQYSRFYPSVSRSTVWVLQPFPEVVLCIESTSVWPVRAKRNAFKLAIGCIHWLCIIWRVIWYAAKCMCSRRAFLPFMTRSRQVAHNTCRDSSMDLLDVSFRTKQSNRIIKYSSQKKQ